jgi:hypothetical protein
MNYDIKNNPIKDSSRKLPDNTLIPTLNKQPGFSSAPPGRFVSVILRNGLGNRIFQILAALGYAEKYNKVCVISRSLILNGLQSHECNLDQILIKLFPNINIIDSIDQYTCIKEQEEMNYSPFLEFKSNVVLQGYFQDERYFPSNNRIPVIRTTYYENTFFIHIRAGDYLVPGGVGINLIEYYKTCFAAIDAEKTISPNIKYIVFSNDNKYADNYMKQFEVKYTISNKVNALEALVEMANCAGGICANSTYSWLGGFFQGEHRGTIFMPSIWRKGRDCKGIYPTWATVIDVEIEAPPLPPPVNINQNLKITKLLIQPSSSFPTPNPKIQINYYKPWNVKIENMPILTTRKLNYKLSDIKVLSIKSGRRLNYNACIIGNRLFFRAVEIIEEDEILTCLLYNFNYVPNSIKTLKLTSSFNNKHVEDPRVILHKGNYFVCYTDGYNIGIAKLDSDCNTIYTHYLKKPDEIKFEGGDGREKNWLPISMGDTIHFWYSDKPRTFLVYEDTGTSLEYKSYIKNEQRITSEFGEIRGGCPPIPYDDETNIWFFHTLFKKKYRIGAYLTRGLNVISITPQPILTGDHIVFPCGAIQHDGDFYISMGVQDKNIGILKVSHELHFVPI